MARGDCTSQDGRPGFGSGTQSVILRHGASVRSLGWELRLMSHRLLLHTKTPNDHFMDAP